MKYLLFIGDGFAVNRVPELGGKTPLEYASTPTIDTLAAKGIMGSVKNCPDSLPAGSDTAILSIFGCDPLECYTGRAPLEAAATGIKLNPGDIAYRCNMVCYEESDAAFEDKRIISHSAGSIEGDVSDAIINALFAEPEFAAAAKEAGMMVYPASSFRHIAVQKGACAKGMKLIPPHDHLGEVIGPLLPSGSEAILVNNTVELAAITSYVDEALCGWMLNDCPPQEYRKIVPASPSCCALTQID